MNKILNSGDLNRKIIIEERSATIDKDAYEKEIWNIICSPFAKVENLKGSKYFNANSEDVKKNTMFTIRYNYILKGKAETDLRIVYNNRNFAVQYINDPDEKHEYYEIVGEFIGS